MASGMLIQGAFVRPPSGTENELALTTSVSATQDLGTGLRKDCMISFISTVSFNINFSETSTVTDPSGNGYFAANTVHSFSPGSKLRYFEARGSAAGSLKWWRSTYA